MSLQQQGCSSFFGLWVVFLEFAATRMQFFFCLWVVFLEFAATRMLFLGLQVASL